MTIAIPSLRAITCTPQWVRNDLWRRARAVPSLDLQFADRKSLVDGISGQNLITFTRASEGTYVDSAGALRTASNDEPRFDHNPTTGESLGLLVEEQRTNEVRNSNNMSAVVTGSPGTLPTGWSGQGNSNGWTREVVGSGSIGTLNYVDIRFSGTPTASQFGISLQSQGVVAASNGQSWAPSVYYQLVGGSISNIGFFPAANLWNSSVAFIGSLSTPGSMSPTSTLQRYTSSGTINNAAAAFISWGITFTCTVGNTYDFTIRLAAPQLELGSSASSFIPTTGSAAIRAADVASIVGANFSSWFGSPDNNTFYVEATKTYYNVSSGCFFSGGNGINAIGGGNIVYDSTGTRIRLQSRHGAVRGDTGITAPVITAGTVQKAALCTSTTAFGGAVNGQQLLSSNAIAQTDWGSALTIGWFPNGGYTNPLNGTIRRLVYWPQRLGNEVLQRITQ